GRLPGPGRAAGRPAGRLARGHLVVGGPDPPGPRHRPGRVRRPAGPDRGPGGGRLQVGAEDHARSEAVLTCVETVAGRGLAGRLGATAPANLRRTGDDLARLTAAGVHVRLVKGAYVEPAALALPYGEPTDLAYLRHAHGLAAQGTPFALATHHG